MHHPRTRFAATLLEDGRVLVAGGNSAEAQEALASAELYEPTTGVWTEAVPLPVGLFGPQATRLPDGRVLVVPRPSSLALLYTPASAPGMGSWETLAPPPESREGTALLSLGNKALLLGGRTQEDIPDPYPAPEVYSPAAGWSLGARMIGGHWDPTATVLSSGKVLVVGGLSTSVHPEAGISLLPFADLYDAVSDPEHDTWLSAGALP